jgi:hypothetical protein
MNRWRPAPEAMIRKAQRTTWTKDRPAPEVVVYLAVWQAEEDGAPMVRRDVEEWACWGSTAARRIIQDVRDARNEWFNGPTQEQPKSNPPPTQAVKVERQEPAAINPPPTQEQPKSNPPSRARSVVGTETGQDIATGGYAPAAPSQSPPVPVIENPEAPCTPPATPPAPETPAAAASPAQKAAKSSAPKASKPAEDPRLRQISDLWTRVWREETGGATYPSREPETPPEVQVWAGPKFADWRARKVLVGKLPDWPEHDGVAVLGIVEQVARREIQQAVRRGHPCEFATFARDYSRAYQRWQASTVREKPLGSDFWSD